MRPTLTSDNQMPPKPNLALNAEIESSGRAANSARCARAFLSPCPNRDRVGLRQPRCLPDDGPGRWRRCPHRARGKPKRRRSTRTIPILSDRLERLLSNNAPEASHDRHQPRSPSDYRQSSERGCARACVLCPKTDRRDENCHAGNPTTTARRHYILCLEAVRRHRSPKCLISLKTTSE